MIHDVTKKDIGRKIIHGIENPDIEKNYGVVVKFDDEFVYCRFGNSKKLIPCLREDLDWDIPDDWDFETGMEESWNAMMDRFAEKTRKKMKKV